MELWTECIVIKRNQTPNRASRVCLAHDVQVARVCGCWASLPHFPYMAILRSNRCRVTRKTENRQKKGKNYTYSIQVIEWREHTSTNCSTCFLYMSKSVCVNLTLASVFTRMEEKFIRVNEYELVL